MEENLIEIYAKLGEDYEIVRARMQKPERIEKFLGFFTKDDSYPNLENAMNAQDRETAFRAAHTLKGTSREVGLVSLSEVASEVCETLRPETGEGLEAARTLMPKVTELYNEAVSIINEGLA